jgi:NTE family protein
MNETAERKIGLALSGGGSRAIAFHLGCLRALNRIGLLERVSVLSTVSGGSVIGAYYLAHRGDFSSFETEYPRNALWWLSKADGSQAV